MKRRVPKLLPLFLFLGLSGVGASARGISPAVVRRDVDAAIHPLMRQYAIPGMAVGIFAGGRPYVFNYGWASLHPRRPVTGTTLFEIGSVTKTFTATLTSYAEVTGHLSLSDPTSRYLPSLRGTPFGKVTLLELGTHTPGGLPLQLPETVQTNDELLAYLHAWRPTCVPATCRTYNNIGIGTLGLITARSMSGAFPELVQSDLLQPLGMRSTFLMVPASRKTDYAEGYTQDGKAIRMTPGELSEEAYGIRTTAADMLRFLRANMDPDQRDPLGRAIAATHTGYFRAGVLTQDLIWEQYSWPVSLPTLVQGNSAAMVFNPVPAKAITPPEKPSSGVWLNKTGSTNGFGAYAAVLPSRGLAIVILANKSYPLDARVTAAYRILTSLSRQMD